MNEIDHTMIVGMEEANEEPVAVLNAAEVAEVRDALESTGRHNHLAYRLKHALRTRP